jgi:hypothetical protein
MKKKYRSIRERFTGSIEVIRCKSCGDRDALNFLIRKRAPDDIESLYLCDGCLDYTPDEEEEK